MGSFFEIIKRVGAIVVVLVLILMMGLIFSSQPIEEITRTIAGGSSMGEFAGDPISRKDYAFYENNCRSWLVEQKLGAAKYFLEYCINTRIRQSYTLAQIGQRLGVKTSAELSKRKLWEEAQTQYEAQTDIPEEDRLAIHEIYRFNLSSFPLDIRMRQSSAQESYAILNLSFPKTSQSKIWEKASQKTTLNLRLVYFDDRIITELLKGKVKIGEAEVIGLFRKEQESRRENLKKATTPKPSKISGNLELRPSPAQRKNIEERIKSTKAKKEIDIIKAKVKHLLARPPQKNKKLKLESIAQLTGIEIVSLSGVSLEGLGRVKAGKNILNLMQKEFLEKIEKRNLGTKVIGPIESGPHTVYAEITKLDFPGLPIPKLSLKAKKNKVPANKAKKEKDISAEMPKSYDKKTDAALTKKFLDYVIDEEASRANFKLQHPDSRSQLR